MRELSLSFRAFLYEGIGDYNAPTDRPFSNTENVTMPSKYGEIV